MPPTSIRSHGGDRAIEDQRDPGRHGRSLRRRGRASRRSSTPAPWRPTLAELRQLGPRLRRRRRRLAPHHRLRRRPRPRPGAVRRRADVLPARHRLPPRQARPRRPPHRHLGADHHGYIDRDGGRHRGPEPSARGPRDHHRPERRAAARRRGGEALQAPGRHHPLGRTSSTRSAPTPPASPTSSSRSTRSWSSTSTSSCSGRWTTRSSTCRWPTPAWPASPATPPARASSASRWRTVDLDVLTHHREHEILTS